VPDLLAEGPRVHRADHLAHDACRLVTEYHFRMEARGWSGRRRGADDDGREGEQVIRLHDYGKAPAMLVRGDVHAIRLPRRRGRVRLGGVYAISAVVDYFSEQLVERESIVDGNPNVKAWNETRAPYRLPGLKFLRTLWVCAISGGPFEYVGRPLGDAHFDFQFTSEEFDEVAAVLADSLDHFNVPAAEKEEVLAAFAGHKPAVIAGSILRG
jgi:hemoglobin